MIKANQEAVSVESAYDAWSKSYDVVQNPTRDLDGAVTRAVLRIISAAAVMELGCGTGKNTGWLAERFAQVTAVDLSTKMLAQARTKSRSTNVEFVQHDIRRPWPADDAQFDLVTCNLILEHIADLKPIYREAYRVLRPGGWLFVCELHPYRQITGSQAQFTSEDGSHILIPACTHSLAEYINDGLTTGLTINRVGEWLGEGDEHPRLLSVLFDR